MSRRARRQLSNHVTVSIHETKLSEHFEMESCAAPNA